MGNDLSSTEKTCSGELCCLSFNLTPTKSCSSYDENCHRNVTLCDICVTCSCLREFCGGRSDSDHSCQSHYCLHHSMQVRMLDVSCLSLQHSSSSFANLTADNLTYCMNSFCAVLPLNANCTLVSFWKRITSVFFLILQVTGICVGIKLKRTPTLSH